MHDSELGLCTAPGPSVAKEPYLPVVANKDPVALWIQLCKLLKPLQLLLVQLYVQLGVQRLGVVLWRPAYNDRLKLRHPDPLHLTVVNHVTH